MPRVDPASREVSRGTPNDGGAAMISIVTPSYNQGMYIEDAIKSVISQEGDFFIDYIICDGGSTDGSVDIIMRYEGLLNEGKWKARCRGLSYRWISERDRGQSHAINKGLAMAKGEVLAWLNSDDYYEAGAFAAACDAFRNDASLAMLYGRGYGVDRGGATRKPYDVEPFFDLWKLIHLYDFILQPSVFMSRSALEKAGCLNEHLNYILDWELWIRLSRFGRVVHYASALSCARIYGETKTMSGGLERWKEIRWCAQKYGQRKWPPVVITQLFHTPFHLVSGGRGDSGSTPPSAGVKLARKWYYRLIGGNKSGVSCDGSLERVAFLSVPLREDAAALLIDIEPLFAKHMEYYVMGLPSGRVDLNKETVRVDIPISANIRKSGFLHMKLVSDKAGNTGAALSGERREVSCRIRDIWLKRADGTEMRDIGLPQFRGMNSKRKGE
jgi:glycosyltransferase involved in cell wall biosynthesis